MGRDTLKILPDQDPYPPKNRRYSAENYGTGGLSDQSKIRRWQNGSILCRQKVRTTAGDIWILTHWSRIGTPLLPVMVLSLCQVGQ
ncbi:hypothetical protein [Sphingobacterium sp. NGMCC 1.201703]|uniref:hypothetical protein n=1 Tax=Sphingobacterium sp. NGMCC 1.201703 TaxID=3388657 RepID=UPI0039FC7584